MNKELIINAAPQAVEIALLEDKKLVELHNENANASFALDKFYREFGIGTGFGLRFDFTFLILRFDVGVKAWDPARPVGSRFVLPNASFKRPYVYHEPVIYNIGIGYPF